MENSLEGESTYRPKENILHLIIKAEGNSLHICDFLIKILALFRVCFLLVHSGGLYNCEFSGLLH
jgi:hypothetical protein